MAQKNRQSLAVTMVYSKTDERGKEERFLSMKGKSGPERVFLDSKKQKGRTKRLLRKCWCHAAVTAAFLQSPATIVAHLSDRNPSVALSSSPNAPQDAENMKRQILIPFHRHLCQNVSVLLEPWFVRCVRPSLIWCLQPQQLTRSDSRSEKHFWCNFEWIWSVATDFDYFSLISLSKCVRYARAVASQMRQTYTDTMLATATTNKVWFT